MMFKCPCGCKIRRKNFCCNISSRLIQYNDWTRVEPGLAVFTRQKLTRVSFNPGWFLPCKQGLTELATRTELVYNQIFPFARLHLPLSPLIFEIEKRFFMNSYETC